MPVTDGESPAPASVLSGKRAAILLYSGYPNDPRPRRSANAMAEAGMAVDLLCIDESGTKPRIETQGSLTIHRILMKRDRSHKLAYLFKYTRFITAAFWFLLRRSISRRYDIVHVHNMPDILVFSALIPKLQGARIVLDLHDPMPELMTCIYGLKPTHRMVRMLRWFEKLSIRFSDMVLTPNVTFKNLFTSRSCPKDKICIVMNSPETDIFDPARIGRGKAGKGFQIIHHGSIVHRHGIDLLVEAVALLRDRIPGIRLVFFGGKTPFLDTILETAKRLHISDIVDYRGPAPQAVIAEAIHDSDLGVIPNRLSPFTEINFPTRIFEYLAMDRPLVAPATTGIKDYFKADELLMFEPENIQSLADKILWVYQNPGAAAACAARGKKVYLRNLWPDEKRRFLEYMSALISTP